MKRILTGIRAVLAVALLSTLSAPLAHAQFLPERWAEGTPTNYALAAVSTDTGLLVKYVGTTPAGGNITVAAGGDISLFTGVPGSGTVDLTTECPVSGALGGIIDVSDAACDTLGEVVDAINASPNWRAVIIDGLRSDSSNDTLVTAANQNASTAKGIRLLKDTTVALNVSLALIDPKMRTDIRQYLDNQVPPQFIPNPFGQSQGVLFRAQGTFTGTGADNFHLISVAENYAACGPAVASTAASIICSTATETESGRYSEPGGGTTVNKAYDHTRLGLFGAPNEKLIARLQAATTFTAAVFSAGGIRVPYRSRN